MCLIFWYIPPKGDGKGHCWVNLAIFTARLTNLIIKYDRQFLAIKLKWEKKEKRLPFLILFVVYLSIHSSSRVSHMSLRLTSPFVFLLAH